MAKKVPKGRSITVNGVEVPSKRLGIDEAKALVGWRDAKKGEHGYPYIGPNGKGKFVLDNNKSNRPFSRQLAEDYKQQMLRGEWAGQWRLPSETPNGETMVVDSEGGIVSCAHRCVGLILAELERQRLVAFSGGPDSPARKKLDAYGCNGPITIETLLVKGVDPKAADTADIGRTRTLGDVIYRRHEFNGRKLTVTDETRLTRELSVARRLVWLRLQGKQVSRGPKGAIPALLDFGDRHPLVTDSLMHIVEANGGLGKGSGKISRYITLGYATGLVYLSAFSKCQRESLEDDSLDLKRRPERWEKAAEFWTHFAKDLHSEQNAIKALHTILERKQKKKSLVDDRDIKCSLVARAFLSWTGEVEDWSTAESLKKGLSKESDVQRFGGLDLDRPTLMEKGFIQSDEPIVRTRSGDWKVGAKTLVVGSEWDPWWGTIESFSDDGKLARVVDDGGYYVDSKMDWLTLGEC